jgi:hypothetical protein
LEWTLSGELVLDKFESANANPFPKQVKTFTIPIVARYFSRSGLFGAVGASYVRQDITRGRAQAANTGNGRSGADDFFVLNGAVGYRLPLRLGLISFEANNILNRRFKYQDDTYREYGSQNAKISPFIPERTFFGRLILNY